MLAPDERQRELSAIVDAMPRGKGFLLSGSAGVGKSAMAPADWHAGDRGKLDVDAPY